MSRKVIHALHAAYNHKLPKRREPLRPRGPRKAELAYLRAAGQLMDALDEAVTSVLSDSVLAQYAAPDEKRDARETFTSEVWERIRKAIANVVGDKAVSSILGPIATTLDIENRAEVARVLSIRPELLNVDLQHAMDAWRRRNVMLIRTVAEQNLGEVHELVTTAASRGVRVEALRAEIMDRLGVARSRADLIARDQILKQNAQLSETRMQRLGITKYRWSTSHDSRVRPAHAHLDGNTYEFANPPDVGDGRRENPGGDFQCRCVAIPVFDD